METIQCYKRYRVFSESVRRGTFFWTKRNGIWNRSNFEIGKEKVKKPITLSSTAIEGENKMVDDKVRLVKPGKTYFGAQGVAYGSGASRKTVE